MHLLLASKSPRRRELLSQLGFPVDYVNADVAETVSPDIPPHQVAAYLAQLKADGCRVTLHDGDVLVTADTVVVHNGVVLGKPHSRDEAVEILRSLSGDKHTVYTGMCLVTKERKTVFTEESTVFFRQLDDETIIHYVNQGTCMDKAGAYGIQEWIGMVGVERIEGCYYNVMGLPLSRLYSELRQLMKKS